ncbi:MFS transporter, partial [bacterium]|nr:MFS transporter [bacterium]
MRKYYTHLILILLALVLYFMSNFQRVAIPGAIFDTLQLDLGLKAPSVTALSAVFMYSYAISLLFCGILADRYGAVKVILGGALLFSAGALIFPNTTNIYFLYLSRAILGVGAATFYLCLVQEAKKCFPDKYFGISVSLMLITGYMGGVCANAPFIILTDKFAWQSILNVMGIITFVITVLFCIERRFLHHIPINEHAKFSLEPFKEVLSKHFNQNLFIFAGLNYGLYYVIQTVIGVKFLKDYVQMSATEASAILSLMIIVAGASGISLATLSTFFNNRRVIFMKT